MARIAYRKFNFRPSSLAIIHQANKILAEYQARGITVTLRQLYYQFVSRDLIANKQTEYDRLGSIINDARLGGLIDWDYLQDRTRNLNKTSHWDSPAGVIESAAASYHRDLWAGQEYYVEVWVEKDALLSVIEGVCEKWDVPFFACRGYTSQSEMWAAGQRIVKEVMQTGRKVRIIHLGDHDPSGVDMTRDIHQRLSDFLLHHMAEEWLDRNSQGSEESKEEYFQRCGEEMSSKGGDSIDESIQINRIALNMDQIRRYRPPPNPAKITDSRAAAYIAEHGNKSWELDALNPDVLTDLIESSIKEYLDEELWQEVWQRQEDERQILTETSKWWESVAKFVEKLRGA